MDDGRSLGDAGELTSSVRDHVPASYQCRSEMMRPRSRSRRASSVGSQGRGADTRRAGWPLAATAAAFVCAALVLVGAGNLTETLYVEVRMLRGTFLLLLMLFLIVCNVHVWRAARINYPRILALDQLPPACCCYCGGGGGRCNSHSQSASDTDDSDDDEAELGDGSSSALGTVTALLLLLWIGSVLVVVYAWELHASPSVRQHTPFVLWLLVFAVAGAPLPVLHARSRGWLLRRLWRVAAAPFYPVGFVDTWIADQLTSLPLVLLDFEYTLCLIVKVQWLGGYLDRHDICMTPTVGVRQILNILPSWFRFAQCLRAFWDTQQKSHLLNAGKYFSTFPVVIAASLVAEAQETNKDYFSTGIFYVWMTLALIHAVYVFSWDVIMDWGLLRQQTANPWLRTYLLYRRRWLYYGAIILDVVLRFAWAMKMSLSVSIWFGSDMLLLLLAVGEVVRRFIWNFFRVEHEQVKHYEEMHASFPTYEPVMGINSSAYECRDEEDDSEDRGL